MSVIEQVYLGIAFVILLSPVAFYRFTRLENPVETENSFGIWRGIGIFLFILSLPVYFGICALTSSFFYLQSYPEMSIFGRDGAEWGGYIQGDAPEFLGIVAVGMILLFSFGLIWALPAAARRWEAKVWEDPGNLTSRLLRSIAYFMHVYFVLLLLIAGLAVLIYFFQKEFLTNVAAIPYWLRQAMAQNLNDEQQGMLIGFAIIVGIDLLFILWALVGLVRAVLSSFWPKTEAIIAHSELYQYTSGRGRNRSTNYRFLVEFSYFVDGVAYASNRLSYNYQSLNHNKPYIWEQTKRYPLGAVAEAFVNPNNPEIAVLEAGIDWFGLLKISLHAAFFFGIATIFLIPEVIR